MGFSIKAETILGCFDRHLIVTQHTSTSAPAHHPRSLRFLSVPSHSIMTENIFSKGTRVWFEDKDQAWISAEVVSVTKAADDSIKLGFLDERGKVH